MKLYCTNIKVKYFGLLCVFVCRIFGSDAQCSPTSSGVKRFGTDCKYSCHCINNQQCDTVTGDCTSGCDFEWVGPGCQFKNIAYGEEARHIDNISPAMYSVLAIDRDLSTCSFTNNASTWRNVAPWWTLWLPYTSTFRKLTFVTKEKYLPHFPNFNLTVQNVTYSDFSIKVYRSSGVLCYKHDASIPHETTVHVTCTGVPVGNLIRLQLANTSTQLVICDFRVYEGCGNGFYGSDCSEHCSSTCYPSGQYTCDNIEGVCLNGCVSGWKGTRCENECERGNWGRDCAETCGHCFSATCNKTNGRCPNGCDAGFKQTDLCNEKCSNGYYGKNCKDECSSTCVRSSGSVICDNVNGRCSEGCSAGWKGLRCKSKCEEGKWGIKCASTCGNCFSTTCNHVNGVCPDGCADGFKPTTLCTEKCNNGYYGQDCQSECSRTCSNEGSVNCDYINGSCLNGCAAGWTGPTCGNRCREGTWGENCIRVCGKCLTSSCDVLSGACHGGNCKPGYKYKLYCDEECENGWYGNNCSRQCNPECKDLSLCRKSDGVCLTETVGTNGETRTTASSTTAVIAGVGAAIIVVIVLGVLSILFYMRRTHHSTTVSNEGKGPKAIYVNSAEPVDSAYDTIQGRNLNEHEYGTA